MASPIGDALEHLKRCDLCGAVHDFADFALAEAGGDADSGLADSAVLTDQSEHLADIPGANCGKYVLTLPERRR
jgi:hypothetical protein